MTPQNGFATDIQASPSISMRTESLASSQSGRSVDADALCKRALKMGWIINHLQDIEFSLHIICLKDQWWRCNKPAKTVICKQGLSLSFVDFWVNKMPGKETYPGTFTVLSATCLTRNHFTDKSHNQPRSIDQFENPVVFFFITVTGGRGVWCHFLFGCLV